MRRQLTAFRPLFTAGLLLIIAVAGSELTLRLAHDARGGAASRVGDDPLTAPCDVAYRRLRPLRTILTSQPDTDESIRLVINSHGLRGAETAVPKPAGVYRVLCLGDETVLGPYVDDDHTVPGRLQQLLQAHTSRRVEVLNAGVPGDCPLLSWLRFRHSLMGLQPDLIVVHVDMTDVEDDRRYRRSTQLGAAGTPIACAHPARGHTSGQRPWWRDLRLLDLVLRSVGEAHDRSPAGLSSDLSSDWLRDRPDDWNLYVQQTLAPLEQIQQAAAGIGALVVVSTCPQPWQVSAEASSGPGVREAAGVAPGLLIVDRAPFDAVTTFCRTRGLLCCDTSPSFREFPEPARLYLRNAPALSRLGNELYARVLSGFLMEQLAASPARKRGPPTETSPTENRPPSSDQESGQPTGVTISFGAPSNGPAEPGRSGIPPER